MGKILNPGVVVSFCNSKGGSGKSTLTAIFAGYMHTIGNKQGLKIGVIDADDTQNTISQIRNRETVSDESLEYEIMNISSSDISHNIEYIKESFDIVLIDLPGNLKQDGVVESLYFVDVAIIPFEPSIISIDGTLLFFEIYSKIVADRKANGIKTIVRGLPNRVTINLREYKDLKSNKDELPFVILDHHVGESKVHFQRNLSTLTETYKQSDLNGFCDEILNLITSYIE
jgi:cellulose biosynthesis protein BcsQ